MNAYEFCKNEIVNIKIKGENVEAKPYSITECWLNVGKSGQNHYFAIDDNGTRMFVGVDSKTMNDKRYYDFSNAAMFGLKNMKVSANGYLYLNSKGYAQYIIKDLNNFERI